MNKFSSTYKKIVNILTSVAGNFEPTMIFRTDNDILNRQWYFEPTMIFRTDNDILNRQWYFEPTMVF